MPSIPHVFVDTSGWGHLLDPGESHHQAAAQVYRREQAAGRPIATTNWVLLELVAVFISPLRIPKTRSIELLKDIRRSPSVAVYGVDARCEEEAWRLWEERPDKDWSLVDCASFVVMRELGITEALTTDHHFEQAGFVCLLQVAK